MWKSILITLKQGKSLIARQKKLQNSGRFNFVNLKIFICRQKNSVWYKSKKNKSKARKLIIP